MSVFWCRLKCEMVRFVWSYEREIFFIECLDFICSKFAGDCKGEWKKDCICRHVMPNLFLITF